MKHKQEIGRQSLGLTSFVVVFLVFLREFLPLHGEGSPETDQNDNETYAELSLQDCIGESLTLSTTSPLVSKQQSIKHNVLFAAFCNV